MRIAQQPRARDYPRDSRPGMPPAGKEVPVAPSSSGRTHCHRARAGTVENASAGNALLGMAEAPGDTLFPAHSRGRNPASRVTARRPAAAACAAALLILPLAAQTQASPLDEITVVSQLRETPLADVPTSITVLDRATIQAASLQHFEELTLKVPNLNWSGDGNRARFFQLRGIGELEQYEGAPNPSVGFIIDDIDLSAIGAAATLFDISRIEVLRGPQGTRYGANALAGLIYLRSADPTDTYSSSLEGTLGSDDTRAVGATISGPLAGPALTGRLAFQHYESDGFRNNAFLGRDDTNGREEFTGRAKLRWQPSDDIRIDLTGLYVDLDNGYDAFAIDNSYTMQSDRPGRDAQRTVAFSLRAELALWPSATLTSITGWADTDTLFSFDADWGNPVLWAPVTYDFTQSFDRERTTLNQELRLASTPDGRIAGRLDWMLGAYYLDLDESSVDRTDGDYDDGDFPFALSNRLDSDYGATSLALFGELGAELREGTRLALGLRGERRRASWRDRFTDFLDPGNIVPGNRFSPTDRMLGGELTLTQDVGGRGTLWARAARGYKAGGFNPGLARVLAQVDPEETPLNLGPAELEYDAEYLWNYEVGLRGAGARWNAEVSLFWQQRDDAQLRFSEALVIGDPSSFVLFSDNAERARSRGVEAAADWRYTERVTLSAGLGLLDTEVRRFSAYPALEGRAFAHAPRVSWTAAIDWRHPAGWYARADAGGRSSFYFDYSHDQRSTGYTVVDSRIGREWERWRAELWVRNLFDREYAVRGFFFGNEPPDFPDKLYTRLADPRHLGLTLSYQFN